MFPDPEYDDTQAAALRALTKISALEARVKSIEEVMLEAGLITKEQANPLPAEYEFINKYLQARKEQQ